MNIIITNIIVNTNVNFTDEEPSFSRNTVIKQNKGFNTIIVIIIIIIVCA